MVWSLSGMLKGEEAVNWRTPMILVTGSDSNRPRVKGLQAWTVFFLTKPFSPAQLRRAVYTVLKTQRIPGV